MRCNIFYRYANLLATTLLILSAGLNFALNSTFRSATPDTFPTLAQTSTLTQIPQLDKQPIQSTVVAPKLPATTASAPAGTTITLSGRTYTIFTTTSLATDAGSRVALYQDQFLFAHSSSAFSALPSASSFSIHRNGITENYKIVKKIVYCDYSNAAQHGSRYDCSNYPEPTLPAHALGYDFILMTCTGQSLPGGDATHRLLAYAVRV